MHYFSRLRLRSDAPSATLADILLPNDLNRRVTVAHKLLWTLFSDTPTRRRDFLWREADRGNFYVLSARLPRDEHALFEMETREFSPELRQGDRLQFSLRANATVARSVAEGTRSKRSDVVMHAIKPLPAGERAAARATAINEAGSAWLQRRAESHGFEIGSVQVNGYRVLRPPHGRLPMRIATLDFSGILHVTEPAEFTRTLTVGLGRAKAYGCGLLLVRRAR